MAYKPYKMKGHALPGIKQRSEKKSPAKFAWAALIPMAAQMIGGMMSKKKEK